MAATVPIDALSTNETAPQVERLVVERAPTAAQRAAKGREKAESSRDIDDAKADLQLFEQSRHGDRYAFSLIFLKYWDVLVERATRELDVRAEAEEVVQDVFVNIFELGERASAGRSVRAYLLTAVKRAAWMRLRRRRIERRWQAAIARGTVSGLGPTASPSADERVRERECAMLVERTLAQLSPACQLAFRLSRTREIADVARDLDTTIDGVKSHIKRALAAIRKEVVLQLAD
jgi:RNA polymerase sigma factor (sigma-70 family)